MHAPLPPLAPPMSRASSTATSCVFESSSVSTELYSIIVSSRILRHELILADPLIVRIRIFMIMRIAS